MILKIKQYEYNPIEIASKEFSVPTEVSYYFETGVRRSIKITPIFTTWQKKNSNKEEELYYLSIICIYSSSECKIEKFRINVSEIESIYYSDKHKFKAFVTSFVNGWFDVRTKEIFEGDLKFALSEIQS
jgi:hypothetical protein